jgi:hypothetical protein
MNACVRGTLRTSFSAEAAGSARFVLRGEPFHRAGGVYRLRFTALLLELSRAQASRLVARALHLRIKHFQGSGAGIDPVGMSEIGEAFEDVEQVLVPRASPDLDIADAALRTERPQTA